MIRSRDANLGYRIHSKPSRKSNPIRNWIPISTYIYIDIPVVIVIIGPFLIDTLVDSFREKKKTHPYQSLLTLSGKSVRVSFYSPMRDSSIVQRNWHISWPLLKKALWRKPTEDRNQKSRTGSTPDHFFQCYKQIPGFQWWYTSHWALHRPPRIGDGTRAEPGLPPKKLILIN